VTTSSQNMGDPVFWQFSGDQHVVMNDQELARKGECQWDVLAFILNLKSLLCMDIEIVSQKEMALSRAYFFIWE
ncbi:MAG: hypothetical protein ACKODZ_08170, partial [Verrucomicrobiota bacterium]